MREADKLVDDLQAVKADMESGDPTLMAHAFGTMATVMSEIARKCEGVPGLSRMRQMLLDNAQDAINRKEQITRLADLQRERATASHKRADQGDLFGGPSPTEEKEGQ
jgi:hypothetical protein